MGFWCRGGSFVSLQGFVISIGRKNPTFLSALLIAVSIQSIGLFTLSAFKLISIPITPLPLLATILGGFIFGVGMAVARVCVTGGWFRSSEGVIGASVALFSFALTITSAQNGSLKTLLSPLLKHPLEIDNIYLTLGISPWWLVGVLTLASAGLFLYCFRRYPSYKDSRHSSIWLVAVGLGILGIVAWILSSQCGRNYGFGISVPTMHLFSYLITGQQRYLNWGSLFVVGIFIGSLVSAKIWRDFEWRSLNGIDFLKSLVGGVLMGIGAYWAGGCTATNALVATAYFSWQGWIAMITMIVGCVIGSSFFRVKHCELRRKK